MFPNHEEPNKVLFSEICEYLEDVTTKEEAFEDAFDMLVLVSYNLIQSFNNSEVDRSKIASMAFRGFKETAERSLKTLGEIRNNWTVLNMLKINPIDLASATLRYENDIQFFQNRRASPRTLLFADFVDIFCLLERLAYSKADARKILYGLLAHFEIEDYGKEDPDHLNRIIGKKEQIDRLRKIQKEALEFNEQTLEEIFRYLMYDFKENWAEEEKFQRDFQEAYKQLEEDRMKK